MGEAVVRSVDKEGAHVVLFSANLEFAVLDVYSVRALAWVAMENEPVLVLIERMSDLLIFPKRGSCPSAWK